MKSLVIKRKLIVEARHSRIMAWDLDGKFAHPIGSDNRVALPRTVLGRRNIVALDRRIPSLGGGRRCLAAAGVTGNGRVASPARHGFIRSLSRHHGYFMNKIILLSGRDTGLKQ